MTLEMALLCNGQPGRCGLSFIRQTASPRELRIAAHACGWSTSPCGKRDLCPGCTQKQREEAATDTPGPSQCLGCYRSPHVDFRATLGHDRLGHTLANLLASHGITTWEALLAASHRQLAAIHGLGRGGLARLAWAKSNPDKEYTP